MSTVGLARLGTSSFSASDWVGPFYPEGSKPGDYLRLYAEKFDTVEVDATYYAVPTARTVDGWAAKTPERFVIAAKFPRSIVHAGESAKPDPTRILLPDATYEDRDRFLEVMARLGTRLGPLLLQFPYFSRNAFASRDQFLERLDRFMEELPTEYRYAVEVRNRGWVGADLARLCRKHRAALVLVDQAWMPHGDEVAGRIDPITTNFSYIRLIGDRKEIEAITKKWDREVIERGERMDRWSRLIHGFVERGVRTLVYVNNHYAGHAPATVRRLQELLEKLLNSG